MTVLRSYELNGNKLSFANWVSCISPRDTPFSSMTKKEEVRNTRFQWQNDSLVAAGENVGREGSQSPDTNQHSTVEKENTTQIFRKVISVSDTARAIHKFGMKSELEYQMKKAVEELKLDIELALLGTQDSKMDDARETGGFLSLIAKPSEQDSDTGAIVHKIIPEADWLNEEQIFDMTDNLYYASSEANVIMFPPELSPFFSSLQDRGIRRKVFQNSDKISFPVSILIDRLGREFKLIPNRWMPQDTIYFFKPEDWTQMVLREPTKSLLAKDGSYEKWMIEVEVGLRNTNPFCGGVLRKGTSRQKRSIVDTVEINKQPVDGTKKEIPENSSLTLEYSIKNNPTRYNDVVDLVVYKDGRTFARKPDNAWGSSGEWVFLEQPSASDSGTYKIQFETEDYFDDSIPDFVIDFTKAVSREEDKSLLISTSILNTVFTDRSDTVQIMEDTSADMYISVRVGEDALGGTVVVYKDSEVLYTEDIEDTDHPITFSKNLLEEVDSGVYVIEVNQEHLYARSPDIVLQVTPKNVYVPAGTLIDTNSLSFDGTSIAMSNFFTREGSVYYPVSMDIKPGDGDVTVYLMRVVEDGPDEIVMPKQSGKGVTLSMSMPLSQEEVLSRYYFDIVEKNTGRKEVSDLFTILRNEGELDTSLLFSGGGEFYLVGTYIEDDSQYIEMDLADVSVSRVLSLDIDENSENAIVELFERGSGQKLMSVDIGSEFSWDINLSDLTLEAGKEYSFMFRVKKNNKFADSYTGYLKLN